MVEYIENAATADDIYSKKDAFTRTETRVNACGDEHLEGILKKYCAYHRELAENNSMTWNAAERSVRFAYNFVSNAGIESTDLDDKDFQKKLETWWVESRSRNQLRRTGGDTKIHIKKRLSDPSISKLKDQILKFLKFVKHINKGRHPSNFNSTIISLPEEVKEIFQVNKTTKAIKKHPDPTAEQIVSFLRYLRQKSNFNRVLVAAIVAVAYDTGCRFSEIATLKKSSLVPEKNYFIANLESSKTHIRSVFLYLSAPYVKKWLSLRPQIENDQGYLFCKKEGSLISHSNMADELKKELKNYNALNPNNKIYWPERKAFHEFRHIFATRAFGWKDATRNAYLGWSQKGMMGIYSNITLEHCRQDYFKMIADEKNPMLDEQVQDFEQIVLKQSQAETIKETTKNIMDILQATGVIDRGLLNETLKKMNKT